MFKPTKKQLASVIGGSVLIGMVALLSYAAVFFAPSVQPIGWVSQPTLSNFNVSAGNSKVYRGEFFSSDWSGRFDCYPVTNGGFVNLAAPCFAVGASSPLDMQAQANTRNIGTRSDATVPVGVEFSTTGLTTTQQASMVSAANINFIRGTSLAPAGLRARTTVLGDIIHSKPYYYADATNPTVFVGANDGMLHAFNATTGDERWAYVPSMLIPKLPALSSTTYVHDYYVDGNVSVGTIGVTGATKNILVGALGAGGKGLYALDISTLTAANGAAAGSKGLWEITNTSIMSPTAKTASTTYANLGDTYSNPIVVPTQDGSDSVVVGNGYNNKGDGCAYLYVINAANGSLIKAIKAGTCSTTSPNGLSSPTVMDKNGDGKADVAYAGDIDGNMWVFDLSNASTASWSASLLYATGKSITQAPTVSVHPYGGYMVNFGTGRLLSDVGALVIAPSTASAVDDTADATTINAAYGLWDNLTATTITTGQLISQTIISNTYYPTNVVNAASAVPVRSLSTDNVPDWTTHRGWVVPLPIAGERVTGDGIFVDNGKFQFNATNPTLPAGAKVQGVNTLFQLDFLTGGAGVTPFLDMDRNGGYNDADRIKYRSPDVLPAGKAMGDPNTAASGIPVAYMTTSNGVQSQPILIQLSKNRMPLFNQNYDTNYVPPVPPGKIGIDNGHFDVDNWYHTTNNSAANATRSSTLGVVADYKFVQHEHEYDKTFNVNGVNLLNPSGSNNNPPVAPGPYWLGAAVNTTIPYKVLVFNQGWNRAVEVQVGTTANWVSTKTFQTSANLSVAALPSFTGNTETIQTTTLPSTAVVIAAGTGTIQSLQIRMPADAFSVKDWWKDGVSMNGLIPIAPECVKGGGTNAGAESANAPNTKYYTGPKGERNDGALTIQVIRADTPDSAIQLNVSGPITIGAVNGVGGTIYPAQAFGYRVKDGNDPVTGKSYINTYVMYEEAVYWHHPSGLCMGDTTSGQNSTAATKLKTGTAESCSKGVVVPADPNTCTLLTADLKDTKGNLLAKAGTSIVTPASCTLGGTYTPAKPDTPAFLAVAAYTGWTMTAPPDQKVSKAVTFPRICGTNDPHNASFTPGSNAIAGNGGAGASGTPAVGAVINGLGGAASNNVDANGNPIAGLPSGSGVNPKSEVIPIPPKGSPAAAHRITWRELIGL